MKTRIRRQLVTETVVALRRVSPRRRSLTKLGPAAPRRHRGQAPFLGVRYGLQASVLFTCAWLSIPGARCGSGIVVGSVAGWIANAGAFARLVTAGRIGCRYRERPQETAAV